MGDNPLFLYRRQFILGPKPAPYKGWNTFKLSNFYLTTHPDLNCIQAKSNNKSIVLLGYLLDPYNIKASDSDILEDIISNTDSKEQFIDKIYNYGGRWILIYQDDNDLIILHDTGGVRQIFYTNHSDLWCGSQPEIIANNTESKKNIDAYKSLKAVGAFEPWANHFWPGASSIYCNINRLLPNHYLDLVHRKVQRYWPNKRKESLTLAQGVDKCCYLLKNLIQAAGNRFHLAHSITSGWDSRLILAASKELFPEIKYYTYKRRTLNRFSPDITIPKKILNKFQKELIEIEVKKEVEYDFELNFRKNTFLYHEVVLFEAYTLYQLKKTKGFEFITINGNIGETGRCLYYNPNEKVEFTPERLASFVSMSGSEYANDQFSEWLKATIPIAKEFDYHIFDLFHLEQKIGGWFAALRTEYDIAEEVFSPINCRALLDAMLKVAGEYRIKKNPILYREVIKVLWPQLLDFPVNPPDRGKQFKGFCKDGLIRPVAERTKLITFFKYLKNIF